MPTHVYATNDYRRFLREELKRQGKTSAQLGESIKRSKAYVSLVLSGARKLDPEVVPSVNELLGMDEDEARYFAALVDLESDSPRARSNAAAVVKSRSKHHEVSGKFDDEDAVAFYQKWYVASVFELVACDGFLADPRWIAATMFPPITVEQAEEALAVLRRLERIEDDGNGSVRQRSKVHWSPVELPVGRASEIALEAHRTALALAAEGLAEFRHNERYMAFISSAMTEERYHAVMTRLKEMMLELVDLAAQPEENPNRVFHLGVQLFPLSLYTDTEFDPDPDSEGES